MTLALREVEGRALPPGAHPVILVIDGDTSTRESLAAGLCIEGFDVVTATDGVEGIALVTSVGPSLILLDLNLADQSGLSVFHQIADLSPVPVIMVTAKDDEIDAVLSLEAGAADHVTKPFRQRELTARIRAVLRRVGSEPVAPPAPTGAYTAGPVHLDVHLREASVRQEPVDLSRKEFDLLALLMSHSGQVVTRDWCIDRLWWDQELTDTRTLDTHIKRLRRKIEPDPANPRHLVTVRGVGFRFEP